MHDPGLCENTGQAAAFLSAGRIVGIGSVPPRAWLSGRGDFRDATRCVPRASDEYYRKGHGSGLGAGMLLSLAENEILGSAGSYGWKGGIPISMRPVWSELVRQPNSWYNGQDRR